MIDLHTHTKFSDGTDTPTELVKKAAKRGITILAITDHDSVLAVKKAQKAGEKLGVKVITGIELSATTTFEMHILGYNFDCNNIILKEKLKKLKITRENRNKLMLQKLNELGANITQNDVRESQNGNITRAHFAKALVKSGFCKNTKEAFEQYLGFSRPAYVLREKLSPKECIELIHNSGGKAFLAHLNQIKLDEAGLYELLIYLKSIGLDGIEAYYNEYSKAFNETCLDYSKKLSLLISAGSDYHGENKPNSLGGYYGSDFLDNECFSWI